jgi:hypothetical protein
MSQNLNASSTKLRSLIALASNAQPFVAHTPAGMSEPSAYIKRKTSKGAIFSFSDDTLPALLDRPGQVVRIPHASLAGKSVRFDSALIAASLVAQAGAAIVVMPDPVEPLATGTGGVVALHRKPTGFAIADPAKMSTVADDADTPVSAAPIHRAAISLDNAITKGFRLELPRSEVKAAGDREEFEALLLASLVLGVARACDDVLLDAIAASAPAEFTLAAAAAQGLRFGDLRGFIGTTGAGAAVGQDGVLRLAGVAAELTDTTPSGIVGAFQHAGVAVGPDLAMHADRIGKAGAVSIQVFADLVPLLPVPGRFWTVAP